MGQLISSLSQCQSLEDTFGLCVGGQDLKHRTPVTGL